MKTIRLEDENGKHIYDVSVPDDYIPWPGGIISHGTDKWTLIRVDVRTSEDPKGPRVEYVVIP